MAASNYRVETGVEINGIYVIEGSGAPLGVSGATDNAPVGSLYLSNDGTGELYKKHTNSSQSSDWSRFVDESVYLALGISFDAEDMGTYTGTTISDNETTKQNLQELETALELVSGGTTSNDAIPAATPTTVNPCLVDTCNGAEFEIIAYATGDETKKEFFKVSILHDGTSVADATTFDYSVHTKLKNVGAQVAGLSFVPKLTGVGAAQTIGLEISATAAITVIARRTDIPN